MIVNNPIYNKVDTTALAKEATLNQIKSDLAKEATLNQVKAATVILKNKTISGVLVETVLSTLVTCADPNTEITCGAVYLDPGLYKIEATLYSNVSANGAIVFAGCPDNSTLFLQGGLEIFTANNPTSLPMAGFSRYARLMTTNTSPTTLNYYMILSAPDIIAFGLSRDNIAGRISYCSSIKIYK
ncbi:MAG: hypothetical protein VB085_13445 [Peptococcaceae bacterium]|nr:hypothetical protein [Peptococcaceae bacterium]